MEHGLSSRGLVLKDVSEFVSKTIHSSNPSWHSPMP